MQAEMSHSQAVHISLSIDSPWLCIVWTLLICDFWIGKQLESFELLTYTIRRCHLSICEANHAFLLSVLKGDDIWTSCQKILLGEQWALHGRIAACRQVHKSRREPDCRIPQVVWTPALSQRCDMCYHENVCFWISLLSSGGDSLWHILASLLKNKSYH